LLAYGLGPHQVIQISAEKVSMRFRLHRYITSLYYSVIVNTECSETAGKDEGNPETGAASLTPHARAKIAMIRLGLTPRGLAQKTGFTRAYVYQLLRGSTVTQSGREKIEAVLGKIWTEETS
jgi:hypothetical protein